MFRNPQVTFLIEFSAGTETWERLETRNPRPTARTQLTTVALTGSFFAANDEPEYPKETEEQPDSSNRPPAPVVAPKTENNKTQEASTPTEHSTINATKSRPLFNKNNGYQLVNTKDEIDLSHLKPWLTKSSTYSLLSNVSTDSFMSDLEIEDKALNMVRLESLCSRRPGHARSESFHNFAASARSSIPRSLTTVRFNPFDPNKETNPVQRDETFDITTSDYASEVDEPLANSFIGISNPVYTEFMSSMADGEDQVEHRSFAQALNPSLLSQNSLNKTTTRLRNDVLSQLNKLQHLVVGESRTADEPPKKSENTCSRQSDNTLITHDEEWSILMLGGREQIPPTIFDRPLSIWMFRL